MSVQKDRTHREDSMYGIIFARLRRWDCILRAVKANDRILKSSMTWSDLLFRKTNSAKGFRMAVRGVYRSRKIS